MEKSIDKSQLFRHDEPEIYLDFLNHETKKLIFSFLSNNTEGTIVDLLIVAALNRSLATTSAYSKLIKSNNFTTAASLIRLEIDSCLKIFALFLVDDPYDYAKQILEGVELSCIKNTGRKKLSESYLRKELSKNKNCTWINHIYKMSSGFIHLSNKHILISTVDDENPDKKFSFRYSENQNHIPIDEYHKMTETFGRCNHILHSLVFSWAKKLSKNANP